MGFEPGRKGMRWEGNGRVVDELIKTVLVFNQKWKLFFSILAVLVPSSLTASGGLEKLFGTSQLMVNFIAVFRS